jgi:hypothetical protein
MKTIICLASSAIIYPFISIDNSVSPVAAKNTATASLLCESKPSGLPGGGV